jgi:hypothetical protein
VVVAKDGCYCTQVAARGRVRRPGRIKEVVCCVLLRSTTSSHAPIPLKSPPRRFGGHAARILATVIAAQDEIIAALREALERADAARADLFERAARVIAAQDEIERT